MGIELVHLKRVGDQIDRAANRLAMALIIAALVVGSSIVMNVQGGPTLFGLPAFGFIGFVGAVLGGMWLGHRLATLYQSYFQFPFLNFELSLPVAAAGLGVSLVAALLGWHRLRLQAC